MTFLTFLTFLTFPTILTFRPFNLEVDPGHYLDVSSVAPSDQTIFLPGSADLRGHVTLGYKKSFDLPINTSFFVVLKIVFLFSYLLCDITELNHFFFRIFFFLGNSLYPFRIGKDLNVGGKK